MTPDIQTSPAAPGRILLNAQGVFARRAYEIQAAETARRGDISTGDASGSIDYCTVDTRGLYRSSGYHSRSMEKSCNKMAHNAAIASRANVIAYHDHINLDASSLLFAAHVMNNQAIISSLPGSDSKSPCLATHWLSL